MAANEIITRQQLYRYICMFKFLKGKELVISKMQGLKGYYVNPFVGHTTS